jgi:hypothetical protein
MSVTTTKPSTTSTDVSLVRLAQGAVVLAVPALLVFAYVGTFLTTISGGGDFEYTADYWYTGVGLPIIAAGIALTFAIHRLQHGADGRLGAIGFWVNAVASAELFVQLGSSLLVGSEVRWGPSYPVCTLLSFIGIALLAAGTWRTGLLPRWMLGLLPVVWILGSFAAVGPTPVVLAAFLILLVIALGPRAARGSRG